jgi:predicted ester cyclase
LLTDDFVVNILRALAVTEASQASPGGRANSEAAIEQLRTDFPDLHVRVDELVADGETVALRMTWTGTQADDLEPWGAPDTGRPMARVSASFVQVACGRIAGVWTLPDNLSMLRQLGVISGAELRTVDTPTVATPAP